MDKKLIAGGTPAKANLTPVELAARLNVHPVTLAKWRVNGGGPKYIKNGGNNAKILYPLKEVEAWEKSRTQQSTSQN